MKRTIFMLLFAICSTVLACGESDELNTTSNNDDVDMEADQELRPDDCVAGTAFVEGICEPCEAGTYCEGGTEESCIDSWDHDADPSTPCQSFSTCAAGQFVEFAGYSTQDRGCAACAAGTFSNVENAVECLPHRDCEAGQFVAEPATMFSDRSCEQCPQDTFSSARNAAICQPHRTCPAGTFVETQPARTMDRSCTACASGTFASGVNSAECTLKTECTAGQFVQSEGGRNQDRVCAGCVAGTFSTSPNSGACSAWSICPAGEFVESAGTALADQVCSVCPDGTFSYTPNSGACVSPVDCPAGQVRTPLNGSGPFACVDCGVGTYCAGGNQPAQPCDGGTWDHDSDPSTLCVTKTNCVAGEYVAAEGTPWEDRQCASCAAGTFSDAQNSVACLAFSTCPSDQVITSGTPTQDVSCTSCVEGRIGPLQATCVPWSVCGDNEKISQLGTTTTDTVCQPCSTGTVSSGPNALGCHDPFVSFELDDDRACGVTQSGSEYCWGDEAEYNAEVPAGYTDVVRRAQGDCGLRESDGILECWQGASPAAPGPYQSMVGSWSFCTLDLLGEVQCFRANDTPYTSVSAGPFTKISSQHGLRVDGSVARLTSTTEFVGPYQDFNDDYLLRTNGSVEAFSSSDPTPTGTFDSIVPTGSAPCGIRPSGALECWSPLHLDFAFPTQTDFIEAKADGTLCGLRAQGQLVCIGQDGMGTATGFSTDAFFTDLTESRFLCGTHISGMSHCRSGSSGEPIEFPHVPKKQVVSNYSTVCMLDAQGNLSCVGRNNSTPPPYPTDAKFVSLRADTVFAGVTTQGELRLWNAPSDAKFTQGIDVVDYSVHSREVCAIREQDGAIVCSGDTVAVNGTGFKKVSMALQGGCAIDANDQLQCWYNSGFSPQAVPVGTFVDVALAANGGGCAIRESDGSIECWGRPQLVVDEIPSEVFVKLADRVDCGLTNSGKLTCWGGYTWNP